MPASATPKDPRPQLRALLAAWDSGEADADIPPQQLEAFLEGAIGLYLYALARRHEGEPAPGPIPRDTYLTSTDILIFVNELLKRADLNAFEVEMFRTMAVY